MNERHWLEMITRENLVINFGNTVFNLTGLEAAFGHFRLVVAHHLLQSHPNGPPGLPLQALLGTGGIRPPLLGVVSRDRLVHNFRATRRQVSVLFLHLLDDLANQLGKLANGELITVTDVDWAGLIRVHKRDETVDEVVHVLEGPSLLAVTIHGEVFALECLNDEV